MEVLGLEPNRAPAMGLGPQLSLAPIAREAAAIAPDCHGQHALRRPSPGMPARRPRHPEIQHVH